MIYAAKAKVVVGVEFLIRFTSHMEGVKDQK